MIEQEWSGDGPAKMPIDLLNDSPIDIDLDIVPLIVRDEFEYQPFHYIEQANAIIGIGIVVKAKS